MCPGSLRSCLWQDECAVCFAADLSTADRSIRAWIITGQLPGSGEEGSQFQGAVHSHCKGVTVANSSHQDRVAASPHSLSPKARDRWLLELTWLSLSPLFILFTPSPCVVLPTPTLSGKALRDSLYPSLWHDILPAAITLTFKITIRLVLCIAARVRL